MVSTPDINTQIENAPQHPDSLGRFGRFGGKYVPETLMPALSELKKAFYQYRDEPSFQAELQGIIPALETAHAIAYLEMLCPQLDGNARIVTNCSGRGDKDVQTVAKVLNLA